MKPTSLVKRAARRVTTDDAQQPSSKPSPAVSEPTAAEVEKALSQFGQQIREAAPEDRFGVFCIRGREVFAPLIKQGMQAKHAQDHLYAIVDRYDLLDPERTNEADIEEIVEEISGAQLAAEPFDDFDVPRKVAYPWWCDPTAIPARKSLDPDRHLFRGSVSTTVAGGGRGKTTQALAEAIQMATGLDLKTKQPIPAGALRVWLVNGEEEQAELDRRTAAACRHFGLTRGNLNAGLYVQSVRNIRLRLASLVHGKPRVDASVRSYFVDFMQDQAIDVLMVDPLVSFHSLNESDNSQMDLLVKEGFGGIACDANAAVELFHHIGKSRPGLAEATVDDGRGASAIVWACRSARVMNFMTTEEAKKLGVTETDRRRHIRIANGKANNGPIGTAKWVKLEVEKLPNGDDVAVASPWAPPNPFDGVTTDSTELAKTLAATGEYREDNRSPQWFGYAIAPHLKIDVSYRGDHDPIDMGRLHSIIKTWCKANVLAIEERKDKDGKPRKFIVVGSCEPVDILTAPSDAEDTVE